jgi:glycosyltransferase involved in cell wall biosynthesis
MVDVSAVVLSKNEEENIKQCLSSLNWCEEIIVIDDFSDDNTRQIAKELGAQVFKHRLEHNFAKQRNYGLKKARSEWVLFVDADEIVSDALRKEITEKLNSKPGVNGFYIPRKDFFLGKWMKWGEVMGIKLLRLGKRKTGEWIRPVHEIWEIKGAKDFFNNFLLHYPHPTVSEFLKELNYYSFLRSDELQRQGETSSVSQVLFYPLGKFIYNYFLKFGLIDGLQGFILCCCMSIHSFLVRSKLFLKCRS